MISLAMIVKNEEASLAHCLGSVKPLVDEIIIVDTGSTDSTIDIAKGFGAQIHPFEWCDDFAAARNEGLKRCKGDWVFVIDADEAIDQLDYEKSRDACASPAADGYSLIHRHYLTNSISAPLDSGAVPNASHYSEGKDLPFYADNPCLRLAKNFDGLSYTGRIHESIGQSLTDNGKAIMRLDAVIHHYGKLFKDREEYKVQYYFQLAEAEAEKDPTNERALYNLQQQAMAAKQWEVALGAAQRNIQLHHEKVEPFVLYGGGLVLQELGRHEEAIKYFDLLLGSAPAHSLAMLRKGFSYGVLGNINMARKLMAKGIKLAPNYIPGHGHLAELELRVGNFGAARNIALGAIKLAPNEPALYDLLIKIEMSRQGLQQAAQDAMLGIERCPNGGKGIWHRLASVYLLQIGESAAAKSMLELGLKAFPGDSELSRLKGLLG
jgi:glycosyltransferase involved in cell wall biosynthesis